jgi:hypothetical protein
MPVKPFAEASDLLTHTVFQLALVPKRCHRIAFSGGQKVEVGG